MLSTSPQYPHLKRQRLVEGSYESSAPHSFVHIRTSVDVLPYMVEGIL